MKVSVSLKSNKWLKENCKCMHVHANANVKNNFEDALEKPRQV